MGIPVSVPSKINTFVKNITKKYTRDRNFQIEETHKNGEKRFYSFKGSSGSYGEDDKSNQHYVIPIILINQNKIYYWLSISLIFRYKLTRYNLIGFSLGIYEGEDNYTESKKLLFRADWDCLEENSKMNHAQPHWHISFQKKESAKQFTFPGKKVKDFSKELKTNIVPIKSNLSKFHFAMFADWYNDNNCAKPLDNESQFKKWLKNCLLYIREQLAYIS